MGIRPERDRRLVARTDAARPRSAPALVVVLALLALLVPVRPAGASSSALPSALGALAGATPVLGDADASEWLVVFDRDATDATIDAVVAEAVALGGTVDTRLGAAVAGFSLAADVTVVKQLRGLAGIRYIEAADPVSAATLDLAPTWGLDRIDQRALPLDGTFATDHDGAGVRVYVVDSGVRTTHAQFDDRGMAWAGTSVGGLGAPHDDCSGHGTAVAGTVAGGSVGVARSVSIVPVRLLDCDDTATEADLVAALDWLAGQATTPAVATLALTGPTSPTVDAAVRAVIAAGITVVAAAGNDGTDACERSPARVHGVLTVAAVGPAGTSPTWSNHGPCVDLHAPGVGILSASATNNVLTEVHDGTSMAAAHVAGVAALALAADPTASPATVHDLLVETATLDAVTAPGGGDPLLVHAGRTLAGLYGPNTVPSAPVCPSTSVLAIGALGGGGSVLVPAGTDAGDTIRTACLEAGGADVDLALLRVDPDSGEHELVAASSTLADGERIAASTTGGEYVWLVQAAEPAAWTLRVELAATTSTPSPAGPPACVLERSASGGLPAPGLSVAATPAFDLDVGDETRACLGGPLGTDFDLVLERQSGADWIPVAASSAAQSGDDLTHAVSTGGRHRWVVRSFRGLGDFVIRWRQPAAPAPEPTPTPSPSPTASPTPAPTPSTPPAPTAMDPESFIDVPGTHLFHDPVTQLAAAGITRGCNPPTNDRYCPDTTVTRAQMAAFLVRALDLPRSATDRFTDDDGHVFEADVRALAAAGITRGCNPPTNDRYCPDTTVTRAQMAAFLVRALDLPRSATDRFTDDDGHVFEADVRALAAAGITRGCNPPTNDRYCPDTTVTRAQMAAFLVRAGFAG